MINKQSWCRSGNERGNARLYLLELDRTVILSNGAPLTGQLTEHCWIDYDRLLSILDPMTAPRTIAATTINPSNNQIAKTPAPIASLKVIGRDLYNITNLSNITV